MLEASVKSGSLAVRLDRVSVVFSHGVHALSQVDVRLSLGTVTGLVGESGSGKTTLCRVIIGLQRPTSGSVEVGGQPLSSLRGRARKRFRSSNQMLLQDAPGSLNPRLTIRSLLREPIAIHGVGADKGEAQLLQLFSRLGLDIAILEKFPYQISNGQSRRVALARALILRPQLLLADEPTAGLDLSVQGEVLNVLADFHAAEGATILISSHNLDVVRRMTESIVVLYSGQVVEHGSTASVLREPNHPYTSALVSAHAVFVPGRGVWSVGSEDKSRSVETVTGGCRFHRRCPYARSLCTIEEPQLRQWGTGAVRCHYPLHA